MPADNFTIKSVNISNSTNDYTREQISKGSGLFFCSNVDEKIPEFDKAPCEKVSQGNHNAFVVLGRDRNASWASGNGGKGMTQCGMIDLVAGRGQLIIAQNKKENKDPLDRVSFVGPMFHSDAARIYITQKAEDIDQYFSLMPSGGPTSKMKSAVAAKADQIRIIGREKVRIYCGRGTFDGFERGIGETNSLGERLQGQVIELQVGNQTLHPMVLGYKLVKYLKKRNEKERVIYNQLLTINRNLLALNSVVATLPGAAVGMAPLMKVSIQNSVNSINETLNTYISEMNALDNDLIPGANHILSDSVFTT
tara:strand:+ start:8 stop:934 length:927 start_codon:yes stop_codon:yes gene_type:complete